MKVKEEKAITLIALVLTIIILLILVGISIASLTGENGILVKASAAQEITKIAEYKETLIMIGNGLRSEKILEDLSTKEYMDRYQEAIEKEIEKGDTFEGAKVERKSEGTIIVTTKEGYIYVVTEDEVKFLGKEGETTPPDLQESNVNFVLSPDSWTNQDVRVEIKSTIEGYSIQYSLDGTTWENYKEAITVKENGTIYARLINELEETGGSATKDITIIDKELPKEATIQFNVYEILEGNNVIATVTQSDGISGVDIANCRYAFTTSNVKIGTEDISKYSGGGFTKEVEDKLTLNGSKAGTYYLHVLTVDRAGNREETVSSKGVKIIKDTIPPNAALISFNTNAVTAGESVIATVTQSDSLSGVDIGKCKWVFTNSNAAIGTEDVSKYTGGTFTKEVDEKLTLTCSQVGTYYLHVLTIDRAGNKKETISSTGVRSSYTYTIISGGTLRNSNYFWCGNKSSGGAEPFNSTDNSWVNCVRTNLWNNSNSYSALSWQIPIMDENATIICDMSTKGGNTQVRSTWLFGAPNQPVAGAQATGPYTSFFGSQVITTGGENNTGRQTYQVSLSGIKNALHVGFFLNSANTSLQRRKISLYL